MRLEATLALILIAGLVEACGPERPCRHGLCPSNRQSEWPHGTAPVGFMFHDSSSEELRATTFRAAAWFNEKAGHEILFYGASIVRNGDDRILIHEDSTPEGSQGFTTPEYTSNDTCQFRYADITIRPDLVDDFGLVAHEFGHALGFEHELEDEDLLMHCRNRCKDENECVLTEKQRQHVSAMY